MEILEILNRFLSGKLLPAAVLVGGLIFTVLLRFSPILHPIRCFRSMIASARKSGGSPFKAVTLALAGTLGVGNIVGVASALIAGGPGSIFWMILSGILVMAVKYAEVVLAVEHRECEKHGEKRIFYGGAPYYIKNGMRSALGKRGAWLLGAVFALLCIANSYITGTLLQVNAARQALPFLPSISFALLFAALIFPVLCRGEDRISDFTVVTIPLFTVLYVGISLFILFKNINLIPSVLAEIVRSAFSLSSALGGALGFSVNAAMRYGISRGLLSNEAGCGTAPTAHASANVTSPHEQGLWGIFEVFVDTVLLCTLTALVIFSSFTEGIPSDISALELVVQAFAAEAGTISGIFIRVAILFFAYATVLCQYFYGMKSLSYITKSKLARGVYGILFFIIIVIGAMIASDMMWQISDLIISLLTLINMLCLLSMSGTVCVLSRNFTTSEKQRVRAKP
ncbi:MAG: sodium:alanine symporter family protein [Clostridia bacterium]|nr:sodium:alanine symporter family protein [Clostridia bacterium]